MEMKLGMVESRFADIVWENEPLTLRRLVILCAEELNWKRTTTYTVLRKFCDRGIFENNQRIVSAKISKAEFHAIQSEQFVEETFDGSLPAFVAAFTSRKTLTEREVDQLKRLVDSYGR